MIVERNRNIANKIMVVGNVDNCHLSRMILEKSAMEYSDIIKATQRNTTAAIAFAAFASQPDDILMVTPSDHIIENETMYMDAVNETVLKAVQGNIVTFGIKPSKPETGYG